MEVDKLTANGSITVGDVTITPISKITSNSRSYGNCVFFLCKKSPEVIIIVTPSGTKALSISGEEVSFENFKNVSGLGFGVVPNHK
jgi:hypothetical protein